MRKILEEISQDFLIGDVGIDSTNYINWGFRDDGNLVILDYAYIYSVAFKKFECTCTSGAYLAYDRDFNNLICPYCGKKYSFKDIRRKITMKDQKREIGDLKERGYVLTTPEEEKDFEPKFVLGAYGNILSKIIKKKKKSIRELDTIYNHKKKKKNDTEQLTLDEILKRIESGYYDDELT